MKLTEEAAREHDSVLEDPAPFVTFDEFGDSALNLTLRAHLASVDERIRIASDLRESINRKFKEAGLVIAFPQRDVHIDTSRPLEIRMQPADRPSQHPAE
jgi:potassium efflux system protein